MERAGDVVKCTIDDIEQRVKETKKKAIEENIKLAEKSGNTLTQTIDEEGNLIGVKETVDFEEREVADNDTTEKNKELMNEAIENKKTIKND